MVDVNRTIRLSIQPTFVVLPATVFIEFVLLVLLYVVYIWLQMMALEPHTVEGEASSLMPIFGYGSSNSVVLFVVVVCFIGL